ncbi:hypothetical protein BDQ17DRAFT_478789 [Cyathus striatus]|nr:hypothetical protein BDQ17DRAFT_478789 [Cyathus striatus]
MMGSFVVMIRVLITLANGCGASSRYHRPFGFQPTTHDGHDESLSLPLLPSIIHHEYYDTVFSLPDLPACYHQYGAEVHTQELYAGSFCLNIPSIVDHLRFTTCHVITALTLVIGSSSLLCSTAPTEPQPLQPHFWGTRLSEGGMQFGPDGFCACG